MQAKHSKLDSAVDALGQVSGSMLAAEVGAFVALVGKVGWATAVATTMTGPLGVVALSVAGIFGISKTWKHVGDGKKAKKAAEQLERLISTQDSVRDLLTDLADQRIGVTLDWITREQVAQRCTDFLRDDLDRIERELRAQRDETRIYHETHDHHLRTIVKLLADKSTGKNRSSLLNSLLRKSLARCEVGWLALQVPEDRAVELAKDAKVGAPREELVPGPDRPLRLVVGDFGSGKSLAMERIHQQAITTAARDEAAPIPVFLEARYIDESLEASVTARCQGLGEPSSVGASIVVDETDSASPGTVDHLVRDARVLVRSWPNTVAVIAGRPHRAYQNQPESVSFPLLGTPEALGLVGLFAGTDVGHDWYYRWPTPVQEAIRRPLFAILLGLALKHGRKAESAGELIAYVTELALEPCQGLVSEARRSLEELAATIVDRSLSLIPAAEAGSRAELDAMLASRLVFERDGKVGFGLPILAHWFASENLAAPDSEFTEFFADPQRLERWRYALITFVATKSHDAVSRIFDTIVRTDPAFAAQVVEDAISSSWAAPDFQLPAAIECARIVRHCTRTWAQAIGPISHLVAPMRGSDDLYACGAAAHGNRLIIGWGPWQDAEADEFEMSLPIAFSDYRRYKLALPAPNLAWAWRWSLEHLQSELEPLLRRRDLPMVRGPLATEAIWKGALALTVGNRGAPAIPVRTLEGALSIRATSIYGPSGSVEGWRLLLLRRQIAELHEKGQTELNSPWPIERDGRPGRWVWDGYSDDLLIDRTREIFGAAVEAYESLVNTWFQPLRRRLWLTAMLPAKITVAFRRLKGRRSFEGEPSVDYYFEPLPIGQPTAVAVSLAKQVPQDIFSDGRAEEATRHLHAMRPEASEWLFPRASWCAFDRYLFSTEPATELAYEWLSQDLRETAWLG